MTDQLLARPFPRVPLYGAGLLVAFTLVAVTAVQLTGGATPAAPSADTVLSRDLRFVDHSDGSVAVYDARDGREVDSLSPGTNGFVRGVLRSFARERRATEATITTATSGAPFSLAEHADGTLWLKDTATGRMIELEAFGGTNAAAFAHLLPAQGAAR